MDTPENALEENRRLRRTMRDLVALSTLPAVWTGMAPDGIARSLADVLLNTLSLDLVYVRLAGLPGEGDVEIVRGKHRPADAEAVRASLAPLLRPDRSESPSTIPDPFGAGTLHVAVTRFGVGGDHGVLVTASSKIGYPTERDRLLLGVGANQTAIVVQRSRAEQHVAEQGERLRTTLESIGDAVITTDTEGRITNLNAVAESLTGWANADAVGQPLAAVFRIVNETTRQPVENPATRALREGVIVGLANHTVLIAKDGTERPIDDSAAPIRCKEGEVVGCVLVFRDVSERRQEEKVQAERSRLVALRGDISTVLAAAQPLREGLQGCCEALVEHIGVAFARIWTHDEAGGVLVLQASAGRYTHIDGSHSRIKVGEFKIGRIAASRRPLLTNDVPHDPNISDPAWAEREGMIGFAGYPLVVEGRLLGVVAMFARQPLTEAMLTDLAPLTDQIAQHVHRKRADDALRESELRYRLVGQAANDAIWDWNLVTNQVTWNEGLQARFGYTAEQVGVDASWWVEHIHPDDRDRVAHDIHAAIDGDAELWSGEYRYRRADGSYANVFDRGRVVRDGGRPVRMVGSMLDLTDRKRAEEATARRSEQVRRLAEVATRIATALDVDSVMGVVNEEARNLIGSHQAVTSFTADQNWGQAINAVSMSDKYARWRTYDTKPDGSGIYSLVCRSNTPVRMTQAELDAHPDYKRFGRHAPDHPPMRGWLAVPLVGREGRNLGLVQLSDKYEGEFTADDEAVLVQLAQTASVAIENARLYEQLRDADRRKDEFLATLAHELRNPLAPVRNALQVMKLSDKREAREQARGMMERQLEQMVRLVDDLMDVSRISRGKLELKKERVPVAAVLTSAVETSRPLIEQMGHDLTVTLPDHPVVIDADLTRLAQVFMNLLNNSAKYMDRGGHIWLTAERQGSDVVVAVRDAGIGIAADQLPRVFELFSQVDRSLEKAQGGLGIGLSLVKRLVEMHGGTIEARSEGLGRGAEFVVRLPVVVEASVPPPAERREEQAVPRSSLRILVVDDNRDGADSLSDMLGIMGNDTRTAYDGVQAVAAAAEFRPDVILLDLGLPKLNGYEACRRIREEQAGPPPVIIAQTGWGQDEDRQRTHEAGFDHHLVKPVDPQALMKLLAGLQAAKK